MTTPEKVAVLGCGLMGSAMARTLAARGHQVTVWNRTPTRAWALEGERIRAAATVADAVRSVGLVIVVTSTYEAAREALATVPDWGDATIVSLCSGTPSAAAEMARWAVDRGAGHLDGAIISFPERIGDPETLLAYAGPTAHWQRHRETLLGLGGKSRLLSEDIGAANVLDTSTIGAFYTTAVSAYVDAATYALAHGVPADMMLEATRLVLRTLGHSAKEALAVIESDDHATEQATLDTYRVGLGSTLATLREAGHEARIIAATLDTLEAAHQAGLGGLGLYAQSRIAAARSSATPGS